MTGLVGVGVEENWNSYQSTRHILKRISFLPRVLGVRTPQNNPSDFLRPLLCVGSNLKARQVFFGHFNCTHLRSANWLTLENSVIYSFFFLSWDTKGDVR